MRTPLAFCNLWHQRAKTLVSIGGVAFALVLVFMQLGFMGAVSNTATNVLEHLHFDILLRARNYLHLYEPDRLDRKWLNVARSTPGVAEAKPFWITLQNWRKLPTKEQADAPEFESQYLPIAIMAFEIADNVFTLPGVASQQFLLGGGQRLLLDESTQADYGPWNGARFGRDDLQRTTEIGGQAFEIAGLFQLGTGLAANGAAVTNHQGFGRIVPWDVDQHISLGLIDLSEGDQLANVLDALQERMRIDAQGGPTVVEILTKDQALQLEKRRWLWETPIGLIFQMGVALSLFVGSAIVYMVLSTDVTNRLPEYATLLAMGYSRGYLSSIVMTQAITLSFIGFVASWAAAEVLYRMTSWASGIPIKMSLVTVCLVGVLGTLMCCCSGLLALRKLWKAEPASLF